MTTQSQAHSQAHSQAAKPKKPRAKKSASAAASHPPFLQMIIEGIQSQHERKGSSRQALLKFVVSQHGLSEQAAKKPLNRALRAGVASGALKQTRANAHGATGRFRIGDGKPAKARKPRAKKAASAAKKPKKAAAKKTARKSTSGAAVKKAAPKKRGPPKARKAPAAKS